MVATSAIRVPTQDGEGVVEIQPESLPEEVEEMTDLLEKEVAPLSVWLQVGLAYYAKGDRDSFEKLMHMCTNDSVLDNYYQSDAQGQAEVLSSFASFKLEEAKRMAEENNSDARRKRDDLIVEASSLYSKAATVSNNASVMEVHSGFLEILGRKDTKSVQRAENMFKKALASESENIIAQIGLANLLLRKADKEKGTQSLEESLTYYKKVLRSCPTVPADVRLCIALIFQRLNFVDKARDAFERVLELDNENVTARVGLALLDLNNRENLHYDEKEIVQRAMKLLEEAFFIDPFHPMVLVHLANHYFISGTDNGREKSLLFAIRAFNSAKSNRVKAEARFMSGRALYYSGDVQTASDHFEEALSLWKEFPLALLGHGQCMISTGDLKSAESIFDSLHQLVPGSIFVIKCLGSLQSATGNRASAIKMLKRATELDDSDPYSLMLLGEQLQTETAEPKLLETKKLFEKSVAAFKNLQQQDSSVRIPHQLFNSAGILCNRLGLIKDALYYFDLLDRALSELTEDEKKSVPEEAYKYNHAIAFEECGRTEEALAMHNSILEKSPNYLDSVLRITHIHESRGDHKRAEDMLRKAKDIDDKNPLVLAMQSNICIAQGNWKQGQELVEEMIKNDKNNKFANLNMAYINYLNAQDEKHWKRAFDFYLRILKLEPSNITAATGIAMLLAERGRLDESRRVLDDIVDAKTDIESVWLNLAHVFSMMGKQERAAKQYKKCLNLGKNKNDVHLLMYLARSLFLGKQVAEAKRYVAKALFIDPDAIMLWYNYARITFEGSAEDAKLLKSRITDARKREPIDTVRQRLSLAKRTVSDMETALHIFTMLSDKKLKVRRSMPAPNSMGSSHGFKQEEAKRMAAAAKTNLKHFPQYVAKAQKQFDYNASELAEEEEKKKRKRKEEEVARQAAAERQRQAEEEKERTFEQKEAKMKEEMEKAGRGAENSGFIVEDPEPPEVRKKTKQTKLHNRDGKLSHTESEPAKKKQKKHRISGYNSASEGEESSAGEGDGIDQKIPDGKKMQMEGGENGVGDTAGVENKDDGKAEKGNESEADNFGLDSDSDGDEE